MEVFLQGVGCIAFVVGVIALALWAVRESMKMNADIVQHEDNVRFNAQAQRELYESGGLRTPAGVKADRAPQRLVGVPFYALLPGDMIEIHSSDGIVYGPFPSEGVEAVPMSIDGHTMLPVSRYQLPGLLLDSPGYTVVRKLQ